ncbi:MAG TPA: methyltransferase domain-containing protein [bacterium]
MTSVSRRLLGVLTDLGYLLLSRSPRLRPFYRRWAGRRYRTLAPLYDGIAEHDPLYLIPLRAALERLEITPRWIAEIGAGTGAATTAIRDRFPFAAVVALDATREMLRQIPGRPEGAVYRVVGDAFALPLRAGSAGLTVVHNAPFDLGELLRATMPSGLVLIVLSSARWIPSAMRSRLIGSSHVRTETSGTQWTSGPGVIWVFQRR